MKNRLAFPFEVKSVNEKTGEFTGYGSVFGVKDYYGEVVVRGAFAKSLADWGAKGKLPPMLWQHSPYEPIGVWTKMVEDDTGLYSEGRILLEAGELERRAHAHLKAGTVSGLSIGFVPVESEYDSRQGVFLLKEIDLWELSLVTFPANPEAQVETVKSALGNPKDMERLLREAGFSRSQAKAFMAKGFAGVSQREAAEETAPNELLVDEEFAQSIRNLINDITKER